MSDVKNANVPSNGSVSHPTKVDEKKESAAKESKIPSIFEGFAYSSSHEGITKIFPSFFKVIEDLQKSNSAVTNRAVLEAIREKLGKSRTTKEHEIRARCLRFLEHKKALTRKKDSFEYTVDLKVLQKLKEELGKL